MKGCLIFAAAVMMATLTACGGQIEAVPQEAVPLEPGPKVPQTEQWDVCVCAMKQRQEEDRAQPDNLELWQPLELILQNPELPNGCEITSMAMVLDAAGYPVDKLALYDYLPRQPVTSRANRRTGPDPELAYAGDAASETGGWYCFEGPLVESANRWLEDQGGALRAVSATGLSRAELDTYAQQEIPVVCWATLGYEPPQRSESRAWRLPDGTIYRPYVNLHCVVLAGADGDQYRIADPISGMTEVDAGLFWESFSAMGSRAVVLVSQPELNLNKTLDMESAPDDTLKIPRPKEANHDA